MTRSNAAFMVNYSGLRVHKTPGQFLKGEAGYKPLLMIVAVVLFLAFIFGPTPSSLTNLVNEPNVPGFKLASGTTTIREMVNKTNNPEAFKEWQAAVAAEKEAAAGTDEAAKAAAIAEVERTADKLDGTKKITFLAKVTVGILLLTAFFWASEALSLGAVNILVAVLMYVFAVMEPEQIAKAYMKDAVFFIAGILAIAVGVAKTGLDKRIGLILLGNIKSAWMFALVFMPLVSICAAFLSEHALVALLMPVLMGVYKATCIANGVKRDRALAVFLTLGLCFAANVGGPGSPAAGGRNAIMVGYFADKNIPIQFLDWMKYGMPLVPFLSLAVAIFLYISLKRKFTVKTVNPSLIVREEVKKLPKFAGKEKIMALILIVTVGCWVLLGEDFAIGGPTIMAVLSLFIFRIVTWQDLQRGVALDVVGMYAAACAIGTALALTGGAIWFAREFVDALPGFMQDGNGLIVGVSILTGTVTNFMSDGATVGAIGPVALPMADIGGVSAWQVGLACAFSSSFANALIVGTPNNAIAYTMARDPETGEKLVTVGDFAKYGLPAVLLNWLVLWGLGVFGWWQIVDWPH